MPKKKVQHKGKPKCATEESEDIAFRKNDSENTEEEYTTVADSEANKKFSKRLIRNNWSKYEARLSDFESEDEVPRTNDFNYLLKTASSDYSHFQLSSEKLWKSEESTSVPPSNIFNLDLNILSSGLACVPFYEMMGLDESDLTVEDKQRLNEAAQKSWKEYDLLIEKLFKKREDEPKTKTCENSRTLEESFRDKLELNVNCEKEKKTVEDLGIKELAKTENVKKVEMFQNNESEDKKEEKSKLFFKENDKDLEDWLDSVLDD